MEKPNIKFRLSDNISSWEAASEYSTPIEDIEKSELKELTQKAKEVFFA